MSYENKGERDKETNKFKLCDSDECKDKVFEYQGKEYHGTMNNSEDNQCIECGADLPPDEDSAPLSDVENSDEEGL